MVVDTAQEIKQVSAWPDFFVGLRRDMALRNKTKMPKNSVQDSLNVRFLDGSVIKRPGYTTYLTGLTGRVRLIDEWYDANAVQHLIIATDTNVYEYNVATGVNTDRTPTGGLHGVTGSVYQGVGFYGKYFITNNVDQPLYWDGIAAKFVFLTTTGAPVKSQTVVAFSSHLLWLNVQDSVLGLQPQEIIWSDNQNGLTYNSGDAAVVTLEDTNDAIIGTEIVQNVLAIARQKSIYISQFIGFPFFYLFQRRVEKYGILATNTFKKTETNILGLDPNGVLAFDGANLDAYVGEPVKDDIIALVPQNPFISGAFATFDLTGIAWRLFVSSRVDGNPDTEYEFHDLFKCWAKHSYAVPITAIGSFKFGAQYPLWSQLTSGWNTYQIHWNDPLTSALGPAILYGDMNGNIYITQTASNDNGQAINAFFKTIPSELELSGWIKELWRLQFILTQQTTGILTVHVYASDDGEVFTEAATSPYTLNMANTPIPFIDVFATGCWFYLYVLDANLNETFSIREIRATYMPLYELEY